MSESSKYKSSRPRIFLFFLLLSFIFWMLARSSRQNSTRLDISLNYQNVPENTLVGPTAPRSLAVELKTTGFQYLFYKLKSPGLDINLAVYASAQDTVVRLDKDVLRELIVSELGPDAELRYVSGEDLIIPLEKIINRRIPIVADIQLSYGQGYRTVGAVRVEPDSVTLTGPKNLINTIASIPTQPIQGDGIVADIQQEVQLILPTGVQNDLSSEVVTVSMRVSEFLRKEIQLSPQITNLPNGTQIRLIPETVKLSFDVSVDQFNAIGPEDFEVVCDFETRNDQENFMIPRISKYPDFVQRVELADKKIDYLIFK